MMKTTPVALLILDGFGWSEDAKDNAIALAKKPHWDALWAKYPHTLINASENFVGLPQGQMGNSEVGHLNIGAGRVVFQDFERINNAIADKSFFGDPKLLEATQKAKAHNAALHIFGLISNGGVHSHQDHIYAMMQMAVEQGVARVFVHAFLDGRDTPPISAKPYLAALQAECDALNRLGKGSVKIASICGRYYAMDRDKRWPRVEVAYDLITEGIAEFSATSALQGLEAAYARDENDEFVKPTVLLEDGKPVGILQDGDVVVYMNFRSDRARQLTHSLLAPHFDGFHRRHVRKLGGYYTLTEHDKNEIGVTTVFEQVDISNTFGEYVSNLGLTQLRIAETEKYPHVTFFFNGGEEKVFTGEERILVPSPDVATYDLKPEMSAFEVTQNLEAVIAAQKYNAIICNFANCDMVGHTGDLAAAIKAVETIDTCIGRVVAAMQKIGGEVIITADHGNAELMFDEINQQPHTQHTLNLVPCLYIGRKATMSTTGALSDLSPTLLYMMGVAKPAQMTGHSLVQFA